VSVGTANDVPLFGPVAQFAVSSANVSNNNILDTAWFEQFL